MINVTFMKLFTVPIFALFTGPLHAATRSYLSGLVDPSETGRHDIITIRPTKCEQIRAPGFGYHSNQCTRISHLGL